MSGAAGEMRNIQVGEPASDGHNWLRSSELHSLLTSTDPSPEYLHDATLHAQRDIIVVENIICGHVINYNNNYIIQIL